MKRLALILAMMAGPGWADTAAGTNTTGNSVLESCTHDEIFRLTYCIGYVSGVWEGIKIGAGRVISLAEPGLPLAEVNQRIDMLIGSCVPPEVTNQQLIDVFIQYLEQNPEKRHHAARSLMLVAMSEAFPCAPF